MIYEFLAIRVLARYFGGAMDVWASEIAICLLGLAAGYGIGGLLADRYRAWWPIGAAFLFAGASALFTETLATWSAEQLLNVDAGLYWHPLLAAATCSFLPLLALGAILPLALRLAAHDINRVGATTG